MPDSSYSNCKDLFAALSSYLDAELPPGDCAEIEKHIAGCEPCVEFVASLKKSVNFCRGAETLDGLPPLSNDTREKLLAAYKASIRPVGA